MSQLVGNSIRAAAMLVGIVGILLIVVSLNRASDPLVLSDNATQALDGNWTDVRWGQQWSAGAQWQHSATTFSNLRGGLLDLRVGVHPVFTVSVQATCNIVQCQSCSFDSVCCPDGGAFCPLTAQADPCHPTPPFGTQLCTPYRYPGESCDQLGYRCLPNLTCVGSVCQAPPTPAPTAAPTPAPTPAPTAAPTPAPTAAPTKTPTQAPSGSPTADPTPAPTAAPTKAPTTAPTAGPTGAPSAGPTTAPTQAPTATPTQSPSAAPTESPCPPEPATYTRLVVQRGADPLFYQVGPAYAPVATPDTMLVTLIPGLVAQAGDVYKLQWLSDCPSAALEPVPVDLGLLGVPGQGVQSLSAYLVATQRA